jgi:hypothetical protein
LSTPVSIRAARAHPVMAAGSGALKPTHTTGPEPSGGGPQSANALWVPWTGGPTPYHRRAPA